MPLSKGERGQMGVKIGSLFDLFGADVRLPLNYSRLWAPLFKFASVFSGSADAGNVKEATHAGHRYTDFRSLN